MKLVGLREAKQSLSAVVAQAQKERVVVTKHGRPAVLLIGVEGQDLETLMLAADRRFWSWIEERRRQGATISLAEVEGRYGAAGARTGRQRRAPRKQQRR